jgi:NAD kinase
MNKPRILLLRKMSALEFFYKGNHKSHELHAGRKMHDGNIVKIEQILRKENIDFDIVTRRELSEKMVSNYDAVISAGGDGTVIATAAKNKETPQLNLKTDKRSVGALCQKNISKAIYAFLSGDYRIENWTRIDIFLDNKFLGRALNQVYIAERLEGDQFSKYKLNWISNDGIAHKVTHGNSGLVIATGTGSTGWKAEFKGYPRDSRDITFSGVSNVPETKHGCGKYFKVKYLGHEGRFRLDSVKDTGYDLPRDSVLEVKISDYPLKVIIPNI